MNKKIRKDGLYRYTFYVHEEAMIQIEEYCIKNDITASRMTVEALNKVGIINNLPRKHKRLKKNTTKDEV